MFPIVVNFLNIISLPIVTSKMSIDGVGIKRKHAGVLLIENPYKIYVFYVYFFLFYWFICFIFFIRISRRLSTLFSFTDYKTVNNYIR